MIPQALCVCVYVTVQAHIRHRLDMRVCVLADVCRWVPLMFSSYSYNYQLLLAHLFVFIDIWNKQLAKSFKGLLYIFNWFLFSCITEVIIRLLAWWLDWTAILSLGAEPIFPLTQSVLSDVFFSPTYFFFDTEAVVVVTGNSFSHWLKKEPVRYSCIRLRLNSDASVSTLCTYCCSVWISTRQSQIEHGCCALIGKDSHSIWKWFYMLKFLLAALLIGHFTVLCVPPASCNIATTLPSTIIFYKFQKTLVVKQTNIGHVYFFSIEPRSEPFTTFNQSVP